MSWPWIRKIKVRREQRLYCRAMGLLAREPSYCFLAEKEVRRFADFHRHRLQAQEEMEAARRNGHQCHCTGGLCGGPLERGITGMYD